MERRGRSLGKSAWWPPPSTFHCGRQHEEQKDLGPQALGLSPVSSVTVVASSIKQEVDSNAEKTLLRAPLDFKGDQAKPF